MNEDLMNRILMIATTAIMVIAGIGTVIMLILTVTDGLRLLLPSLMLAGATVGAGFSASYFGGRVTGHAQVFTNVAEREVLTNKQRRTLRRKRGEVVMERALVEIENERDNIVHRQIEASKDPDKPPHQTQWTPNESKGNRLPPRRDDDYKFNTDY